MNYKEKLEAFNQTDKYSEELRVLQRLIGKPKGKVLDYGCGLGKAVEYLRGEGLDVHGYDAVQYRSDFTYHPAIGEWKCVYFMHSIAHIPGIKDVLSVLDTQRVVVITPNREWLDLQNNDNYHPDTTVLRHYTCKELHELFLSVGFSDVIQSTFGASINGIGERICLIATR